jgi:paraquat-inducible protein B
MSKKANPTLVGAFVVTGVVLLVSGALLFAAVDFFSQKCDFICYFEQSVSGLEQGSAVKFQGVTIGRVKEIMIHFNQDPEDSSMPVLLELDQKQIAEKTDSQIQLGNKDKLEQVIARGLRARLESESFVTGRLYVGLDISKDAPAPDFHQIRPLFDEIPTMGTDITELLSNLAQFDVKGLSDRLTELLTKMETQVDGLQLQSISRNLTNVLVSLERVVDSPAITNMFTSADSALQELELLSRKVRGKLDPLASQTESTLREMQGGLEELRGTFAELRDALGPHAPLRAELIEAVRSLGEAARNTSDLADFLTRNPSALISGRAVPQSKSP